MIRRSSTLLTAAVAVVMLLFGCGISVPADPDGTLDRVRGGTLEVGISPSPPWTDLSDGDPRDLEVDLVERFATSLDASIDWHEGGEESLMGRLELGELDLVVGGLTDASPWTTQAVLTQPFVEATGEDGSVEKHVMAARLGENAFLFELERYLLDAQVQAP